MQDNTSPEPVKGPIDSSQISPEDARTASMEMLDNEFEIEVAGKNQIIGRWAVDAERAKYVGTQHSKPLNMRGVYVYPHDKPEAEWKTESATTYPAGKMGEYDVFYPGESDTVYAIGIAGTSDTYAHEFRHRAFAQTDMSLMFMTEEKFNRLLDGAYATTDASWTRAVGLWQDQMLRETDKEVSLLEAEQALVQALKDKEDMIIANEELYLERVGKPYAVPTVNGWFGPRKQSLEKARKGNFPLPWKRFEPVAEARRKASEPREE